MKFIDLVNVSAACKRFFLISKAHKKFRQTITFSKRIFNFDGYYTEFLQNQLLNVKAKLHKKFNEELSSAIFSIISVKMKKSSYELTPFRVFCHCFFCTRGSRSFDGCSICSRIFVNDNYVAKKLTVHLSLQEIRLEILTCFYWWEIWILNVLFEIFTTWLGIMLIGPKILMKYFMKLRMVLLVYMSYFWKFIRGCSLIYLNRSQKLPLKIIWEVCLPQIVMWIDLGKIMKIFFFHCTVTLVKCF